MFKKIKYSQMLNPNRYFLISVIAVVSFIVCHGLIAQPIPTESIYLHTDRNKYLPGDTIWFKAYMMQNGEFVASSTTLYVAVFDGDKQIVAPVRVPVIDAMADGRLVLPDSGMTCNVSIIAATNAMLVMKPNRFYVKRIELSTYNRKNLPPDSTGEIASFYPGGGHFVDGVENKLAVALKTAGKFTPARGYIINDYGAVTDSFAWGHNVTAMIKVTPDKNHPLYLAWQNHAGVKQQAPLPVAETAAVALTLEELNGSLACIVNNPNATKAMQKLRMEASFANQLVYKAVLNMFDRNLLAAKIPTAELPAGLLRIALYDSDDKLVADELAFVNQQKVAAGVAVNVKTKGMAPRSKNEIEISIADSTPTNLSVAVYDVSQQTDIDEGRIYEDLVFATSIENQVNDAGWYFSDTTAARRQLLAVLMQMSSWQKPADNQAGAGALSNYLGVTGSVADSKGKPAAREHVTMVLSSPEEGKKFFRLETDDLGRFLQEGLIFYDSATVSLSVENAGKRKLSVQPLVQPPFEKPAGEIAAGTVTPFYVATPLTFTDSLVYAGRKQSEAVLLQNVTVVKYKSQMEKMVKMDEKYASGPFRGGASSYAFDVMGDSLRDTKFDIYNYIQSKGIPGLEVVYNGYRKEFRARRGPVSYFINESEVDKQRLENINLWDIAYVKYIEMFGGRNGFPPAIVIYLKKEADYLLNLQDIPGKMTVARIAGYATPKVFYSPHYASDFPANIADVRTTLYWQPYISLGGNARSVTIPFYNNDFSKKLKLVLEGVNENGSVIHIEKIIE